MSKTINGIVTWLRSWFYTKTEVDSLVGSISIEDTDLFDVLQCVIDNFDDFDTQYLFYDECNSETGLSNYGSVYSVENNTNATLTYDSTMNAYKISNTGGGTKLFPITALTGLTSLHLEAEFYLPSTTNRNTSCGLEVVGTNHTSWGTVQNKVDNLYGYHIFRNNSFVENVTAKSGANLNEWIRFKIDIDGVNVTYSFEQLDGTVIYQSTTLNLSTLVGSTYYTTAEDRQYGISIAWNSYTCYSYVRNIKATTL